MSGQYLKRRLYNNKSLPIHATSSGTPARIHIANGLLLETTVVVEAALFTVCVTEPLLPV
jgi:hypothetical protein